MDELGTTVEENDQLSIYAGWCEYWNGDVNAAQTRIDALRQKLPDDSGLRQLALNVVLERGAWRSLGPLLDTDLEQKENRDARELLQSAGLANLIGNPNAMKLAQAGVDKEPENPNILLSAYNVAIQCGEDWGETAGTWLQKAIRLSDENGPIQTKSVQDVFQMREENIKRANELDQLIMSSSVTLPMAAKHLNMCLSEFILDRVGTNADFENPLDRLCLPFYSGNRLPMPLLDFKSAAFDPASILMLYNFGLLDAVFDVFEEIVLPSETMPFFFYDIVNSDKGQPSRAARARELGKFIRDKKIKIIDEASLEHSTACADEDVSILYAAAEASDGLVIHNSPIYTPGTFMEEQLDASPLYPRLGSCKGIADALLASGEITSEQRTTSSKWQNFDDSWPSEPEIDFSKPFFIDGLAVSYLHSAGLLPHLFRVSKEIYVRQQVVDIAEAETREQESRDKLKEKIEAVCEKLRPLIASGKARIAPTRSMVDRKEDDDLGSEPEPLLSVLHNFGGADVLISDDRVLNRYAQATDKTGAEVPIGTSLDVLDMLLAKSKLTEAGWLNARQKLRESGVAFIPVTTMEAIAAVKQGNWAKGPPRAALAMRDSIHLPLLRNALVLPLERHWLEHLMAQLTFAIRQCFADLQPEIAPKAARFLWDCMPDVQSVAGADNQPDAGMWAENLVVATYCLLSMPLSLNDKQAKAYHNWFAATVEPKLNGRHRALRPRVIDGLCHSIAQTRDETELTADDGEKITVSSQEIARWQMAHLPPSIFEDVIQSSDVQLATGRTDVKDLAISGGSISTEALVEFFAAVFAGQAPTLLDNSGNEIGRNPIINDDGSISVSKDGQKFHFGDAGLFSPKVRQRNKSLGRFLKGKTLASRAYKLWAAEVRSAPLTADRFLDLLDAAQHAPELFLNNLPAKMTEEDFSFDDFIPCSDAYFENLLGVEFANHSYDKVIERFEKYIGASKDVQAAIFLAAPFAVAPTMSFSNPANSIAGKDWSNLCQRLMDAGDPFSKIAAFEIISANIDNPKLKKIGAALIQDVFSDESEFDLIVHNFCAAAVLSLGVAQTKAALEHWPVWAKRLALLAHAGHVSRTLHQFDVTQPEFLQQALASGGGQFDLAEMLNGADAQRWQKGYLNPELVKAYFVKRLDAAMDKIEPERRPKSWSKQIQSYVEQLKNRGSLAFASFPGPMEGFSAKRQNLGRLDREAFSALVKLLDSEIVFAGIDCLLVFSVIAQPPTRKQTQTLRASIIDALKRIDDDRKDQAIKAVLAAARNWNLTDVASDVLSMFTREHRADPHENVVSIVETVVGAAMAAKNATDQANRIAQGLREFVYSRPTHELALRLRKSIDVILNLQPSLAPALHKMRAAALLQQ